MSRQQDYRNQKIAEGLCGRCGVCPLASTSRCEECLKKHRQANGDAYRAKRIAAGFTIRKYERRAAVDNRGGRE